MKIIWPLSFNFLYFACLAFFMPFAVLYYQSQGLNSAEIGILVGITPLINLIAAPLWTGLADATRKHRLFMGITTLVGAILLVLIPFFNAFIPILLLIFLLNIFFAPVAAFADSASMFMLADKKEMYGRIRLGGTIGYGVAAIIAGALVQNYGLKFAFWGGGFLFFIGFLVSQQLSYRPSQDVGVAKETVTPQNNIRNFLTNPRWVLFLILALFMGLAMSAMNNYLFSYMKDLGAKENIMGLALTVGTLSEIPVLFWGNRLIKKLKPRGLLTLGMVVTGVRLLALSAVYTPEFVLIIQLINGLTLSATWIASVSYADENAPVGMGSTAQGLLGAAVFGFGSASGGFLGSFLLEKLGAHGMFFAIGMLVLMVVLVVELVEKRIPAQVS